MTRSSRSVIVTMIRHGESQDNLTSLWAGHRNAPLTNHGYTQSMRLAKHFEDVPITAIYCSDLARAQTTARNIASLNKSTPPPPVTVSPLLREQFFGEAEGAPWDAGKFDSAHLPWEEHRAFQIAPYAESLNQVGQRAHETLRHFVMPHVLLAHAQDQGRGDESGRSVVAPQHILLVAHGIWLSEMMFAFKRAADPEVRFVKTGGYPNTGWSRLEVELAAGNESQLDTSGTKIEQRAEPIDQQIRSDDDQKLTTPAAPSEAAPSHADANQPASTSASASSTTTSSSPQKPTTTTTKTSSDSKTMPDHIAALLPQLPNVPPRHPGLPPPFVSANDSDERIDERPVPRLRIKVLATAQAEHLQGLVRTKSGVGSAKWDDKQRGIKEFFGGGGGGVGSAKQGSEESKLSN